MNIDEIWQAGKESSGGRGRGETLGREGKRRGLKDVDAQFVLGSFWKRRTKLKNFLFFFAFAFDNLLYLLAKSKVELRHLYAYVHKKSKKVIFLILLTKISRNAIRL